MLTPLFGATLWAIAATVTALLPMRRQMLPGLLLMMLAPVMIVWLGVAYGWLAGTLALLAFVSMFRRPLAYFLRRMLGLPTHLPPELERGE